MLLFSWGAHNLCFQVQKSGEFQGFREKIRSIINGGDFHKLEFLVSNAINHPIPISCKIFRLGGLFSVRHSYGCGIILPHGDAKIFFSDKELGWESEFYVPNVG